MGDKRCLQNTVKWSVMSRYVALMNGNLRVTPMNGNALSRVRLVFEHNHLMWITYAVFGFVCINAQSNCVSLVFYFFSYGF